MKKILYLSMIAMFSVSFLSASNSIEEPKDIVEKTTKIEKIATKNETSTKVEVVFFTTYTGRCLDGHTFRFEADNRDEAQGYVNGYCRARSEIRANE